MSRRYHEGGRVDVVFAFHSDGGEARWFDELDTSDMYAWCSELDAFGMPHTVVGLDFTPYATAYGWAYGFDGYPLSEREAELRVARGKPAAIHIVDDAIETEWGSLLAEASGRMNERGRHA